MGFAMELKTYSSLAAIAACLAAAPQALAETWDMPLAYPAENFQTLNAGEFAACVKDGTKGAIDITLHPNGSLFKGNDIKRAVQTGQTPIGERLLSAHENENAIFGFDSIPFITKSYEDSVKLWAAARPKLEKLLDEQGLVVLYSVPWPAQGIYFEKDVNTVADMAKVKVRAYNKATARIAELTGMLPVTIEAAEISEALSTGVIESLITSAVTGKDSKAWEQLTHFYTVAAWQPRNYVIMNKGVWDGLDDAAKQTFRDCSAKAEAAGLEKSKTADIGAIEELKKNGMKIAAPSPELDADLKKFGETMAQEWVANAGDDGKAVLEVYRK
jgi:TRAP-type C4-dicarboxylate transport system substrate-binding protein